MRAGTVIQKFVVCEDLQAVWSVLVAYLSSIGFDRVIFAHRDNLSEKNFQNHDSLVLFSTYGETIDEAFVQKRMYINSPTVKWALRNAGWISWADTERKLGENSLSKDEEEVVLFTRKHGLTAGYTYSVPFRENARFRSIFGLATSAGELQSTADAIVDRHKELLEGVLLAFVLAVNKFQKVTPGQLLTVSQIRTLSLLAEGRTLSEIAELEGVHVRTIDKRLAQSRRKLAASNSLQAVVLAERSGQLIVVRD